MKSNVFICPPCGESVALATKEGQNKEYALWPLLPRLTAVLPPQGREMSFGFTLIELLVVVLIIGILAAVAVPQYKKIIENVQMREIMVNMRVMMKNADLYVADNGLPQSGFVGIPWIIEPNCLSVEDGSCRTKWGDYSAVCFTIGSTIGCYAIVAFDKGPGWQARYLKGMKRLTFYRAKYDPTWKIHEAVDKEILCPVLVRLFKREEFTDYGWNTYCKEYK